MIRHIFTDLGNAALWGSSVLIVLWIAQYTYMARWWKNSIGITIVGLETCLLIIFIPSLIALADPALAGFAGTDWYFWLSVAVVFTSFGFLVTRIITWESIRRQRRNTLPERRERP